MKRWKTRKYYELQDYISVNSASSFESQFVNAINENLGDSYWNKMTNGANYKYYPNIFDIAQYGSWYCKQHFDECIQQIVTRHQSDIIFAIDEDEDTSENRKKVASQFLLSMIFIAQNTAEKYNKLLDLYASQKDKLMDALENITSETHQDESSEEASNEGESSRNGSRSGSQHQDATESKETNETSEARSRYSDTPEMAGMYDDEKYTTNLTNGDVSGNSESSGESSLDSSDSEETSETASNSGSSTANKESSGERQTISKLNPMTIMARIKEIDDNYRNIMLAWVNEFDRLFIDGCNV